MVGRITIRWLALPSFLRTPWFHSQQIMDIQTGTGPPRTGFLGTHSGHLKYLILIVIAFVFFISLYFTMAIGKQQPRNYKRFNLAVSSEHDETSQYSYGLVVDCGSSGSRIYIYYWPPHNGNPEELLQIKQMKDSKGYPVRKKIKPGISSYNDKPFNASEYLEPLLDFAAFHVPKHKHQETPLYIMATAGMRLLTDKQQEAILDDLRTDIPKNYDFQFTSSHAEVITGKQEGVYSWIGVNFVLGRFDHTEHIDPKSTTSTVSRKATVGALDMGGASAQIAYEVPKGTFVPSDLLAEVNLGCDSHQTIHNYRVYVSTFLGFGGNAARQRYIEQALTNKSLEYESSLNAYKDPCLPVEFHETVSHKGKQHKFFGTGDFQQCSITLLPLVNATGPCKKPPCSINGVYQPLIGKSYGEFYGFSEYWYSMHDVLRIGGHYSANAMATAAKEFCSTRWSVLLRRHNKGLYPLADNHRLRYQCFKSAWMTTMLHRGFRFPRDYHGLRSAQFIQDKEVQWTLGAILFRTRFLPLREIQHNHLHSQYTSGVNSYFYFASYVSELEFRAVFVFCSIVVLAAIILYFRRLRRMSKATSLWSHGPSKPAVYSMKLIPSSENIPV
ncbi:ectonucleoside triphosphate diphosphohydrolase 4-like [Nematostella vectensis]|uniref:ectonucleoside triphosphate diphosphohydrolase 4-like n=1 Tax=Nematostella vectensis TaxID=45351 RepID=UPI0020773993|nr:ectonucleoside triphosphate diphosphohydrolase 4-like [Nematostella vectensis]